MNDIQLSCTIFQRNNVATGRRSGTTWAFLRKWIEENSYPAPSKDDLPLLKLATFKNDYRSDANLEAIFGIEGDYDGGTVQPANAADALKKHGILASVYTTPSHRPEAPRWRVYAPLSRSTTPQERHDLVGRLNGALGAVLALESFTASQAFYVGTVAGGAPLEVWHIDGSPIDLVAGLPTTTPAAREPAARKALGSEKAPSFDFAERALCNINPCDLDYPQWRDASAAFRQSATGHDVDEQSVRIAWDRWCSQHPKNDLAANNKLWRSLDGGTQLGWDYLRSKVDPTVHAELIFGSPQSRELMRPALNGEVQRPNPLDEPLFGKLAGSAISTELALHIKNAALPLRYDLFKKKMVKTAPMPWDRRQHNRISLWTDEDDIYLQSWFHRHELKPTMEAVRNSAVISAHRNEFNPIIDYLDGVKWDGHHRLDMMLETYFHAENVDFARSVSPKFIIGMVARAYQPGCKRDEVLILEGAQGIGKSTALNTLAGDEYFSDSLPNMHDKDAAQHLQGLWIVEIAELASMRRSEAEDVKRFLATRIDKFRPPFGVRPIDSPRTTVFAATTNSHQYLKDDSGNRRFWPIRCAGPIDITALVRDRDQLFAEAVHRYRHGEPWHLSAAEEGIAAQEQASRQEVDPWHDPIERYCTAMGDMPVHLAHVFAIALSVSFERQNSGLNRRAASILRELGYERRKLARDGKWAYVRKTP
ncbi:VapE domain-containing protein [Aurantimonas sp. A2-1-M11]|uniref:VapE domain-containing protein n=1 Tax=Aurantimonas sp. A2-1-M11 TaxID=3113712 RepID=UPI002F948E02